MTRPTTSGRGALALLCALLLALFCTPASAQTGTSSVRGTVTDSQGNVVPGATVNLIDPGTNTTRTQTSSEDGHFAFDLIPPGTYRVEAEAKGFKKAVVTGEGYVAGAHADQANVTLDGIDINEAQTNQLGGAAGGGAGSNNLIDSTASPDRNTVIRLNADAIQEFRVTTSNPNASQGRSSGAQVELIAKSGKNQIHGSLYEAHRNTIFTANDFFNNRAGVARPKLIRNTYGGSVSGPIVKDKLFFFYGYEGRRDARQKTVVETVPLESLGRGEVRYLRPSGSVTTVDR